MGDEVNQSQDFGEWLTRVLMAIGALALVFYLVAKNSVTGKDLIESYASVGLIPILLIELIDKKFDKRSFWMKLSKREDYRFLMLLVTVAILFISILSLVNGSLIWDVRTAPVTDIIVTLWLMFYLISPETGSSEWLLSSWLAVQLATGFSFFTVISSGIW